MGHIFLQLFLLICSTHSVTGRNLFLRMFSDFDMTFSFSLLGWEGSAHDSRVYDDARTRGLPLILGKYYLGDAGYGLSRTVLTPYRGVRYHLREFELNGQGPSNSRELFNHRHSSLRNTVERVFGVVKRRFPVLVTMSPYDFDFQCEIVQCCFLLHNFVRINQLYEDEFYPDDAVPNNIVDDDEVEDDDEEDVEYNAVRAWRDGIAQAMWADYEILLANEYAH